jgi:hypothetical protein
VVGLGVKRFNVEGGRVISRETALQTSRIMCAFKLNHCDKREMPRQNN